MKVYVIIDTSNKDYPVHGVFSTFEKALEELDEQAQYGNFYTIEEYEVEE